MTEDVQVTLETYPPKHPGTYRDWEQDEKDAYALHWEHIATLNSGSGYDWAQMDVWRRKSDGKLVTDSDAGCSCYGPYDNATGAVSDLAEIDNYATFRDQAMKWASDEYDAPSAADVQDFLKIVRGALR